MCYTKTVVRKYLRLFFQYNLITWKYEGGDTMIWAKEETLPRREIEKIQLARYKADFRDNYPTGLFAVEKKDLVRFHASSGTTGKPTVVGYTKKDLDNWLNNVARIACMGGATPDDVAQIAFGYGTFTGALGLHGGLEKLGAAVIPMSSGNTKKQIMFMQDVGTTLLVATPSYALHLGEEIRARGLDPEKDLKVHIGLFGGEGMTEPMRDEMHKVWGEKFLCTQNYVRKESWSLPALGKKRSRWCVTEPEI